MVEYWKKLVHIKYPANCLECKRIIRVGQTAWWLKNCGLLHLNCGSGSGLGGGGGPDIHVIHGTGLPKRNPFDHILEHKPEFYDAQNWRDSFGN